MIDRDCPDPSQLVRESIRDGILEAPSKLVVFAGCNMRCMRQMMQMIADKLPETTRVSSVRNEIIRIDGRKILFMLNRDLDWKSRGLGGFTLYRC